MNWGILVVIGIIVIILEVASQYMRNKKTNQKIQENKTVNANETNAVTEQEEQVSVSDYNSYKKKYLFTKNEFYFYKQLQKIAENKNLIPLAKVRLADFIEVSNKSEYMKYFAKIRSKHIDFLLLDKETLKIVVAIELDDNSHSKDKDDFKNKLFEQIKIPLIRCKGIGTVESQLQELLEKSNF